MSLGCRDLAIQHLERAVGLYREIRLREPDAMSNQRALAVCLDILGNETVKSDRRRGLQQVRLVKRLR